MYISSSAEIGSWDTEDVFSIGVDHRDNCNRSTVRNVTQNAAGRVEVFLGAEGRAVVRRRRMAVRHPTGLAPVSFFPTVRLKPHTCNLFDIDNLVLQDLVGTPGVAAEKALPFLEFRGLHRRLPQCQARTEEILF